MIAQPEPATSSSTLYQASTNSASKALTGALDIVIL
jgi:hypothetical protein